MTIDPSAITVQQFQAQFKRGFPYLDSIIYSGTALYNAGAEVYDPTAMLFWTCQTNGTTGVAPAPNVANWAATVDDVDNWVQDSDITTAFGEAIALFNPALYPVDANSTQAYLYLTAHFLANDLKSALAGISAPGGFPLSSRSVGSVSEGYSVPDAYLEDPILAGYTTSAYGMKFLALTLPALRGNVRAVFGQALP
jgi:hypothetical protein